MFPIFVIKIIIGLINISIDWFFSQVKHVENKRVRIYYFHVIFLRRMYENTRQTDKVLVVS